MCICRLVFWGHDKHASCGVSHSNLVQHTLASLALRPWFGRLTRTKAAKLKKFSAEQLMLHAKVRSWWYFILEKMLFFVLKGQDPYTQEVVNAALFNGVSKTDKRDRVDRDESAGKFGGAADTFNAENFDVRVASLFAHVNTYVNFGIGLLEFARLCTVHTHAHRQPHTFLHYSRELRVALRVHLWWVPTTKVRYIILRSFVYFLASLVLF